MSEELQNIEQELEKVRDLRRAFEALQAEPAWAKLVVQLEAQIRLRQDRILLTPLADANAVYSQEFEKGEVAGLRLVLRLPQQMVEDMRDETARLNLLKEQGEQDAGQSE